MSTAKQFNRIVEFNSTQGIVGNSGGAVYIVGGLNVSNLNVSNNVTIANLTITNNLFTSTGSTLLSSQWISVPAGISYTNANVGIGTTSPGFTLDISGGSRITGGLTTGTLTTVIGASIPNLLSSVISTSSLIISSGLLSTFNSNTIGSIFTTGGNVGINNTSPTTTLDVNGGLRVAGNNVISTQGIHLQWNRSGSGGEARIINQQGIGNNNSIYLSTSSLTNVVTDLWQFSSNNIYNNVGGNIFIDSTVSGSSFIYGFNTPKNAGSSGILQVYNNSTDRNIVFQVQSKGTTSGSDNVIITSSLNVSGTITSGNTPYKIWVVTGTFPASTGTATSVSLPSGCSPANVISVTGITQNTNGDWIPFNYSQTDLSWNVDHYIQSNNTSVTLVNRGTQTQSRPFRVTIMTLA